MKKITHFLLLVIVTLVIQSCIQGKVGNNANEIITFYEVPLVCGAAPEIGCGSRLKPVFMDTEKEKSIKESWSNRQGTVIAIVWNEPANEKLIQSIFKKHSIDAKLIVDSTDEVKQTASLRRKDKWYKGMEVDQLSIEEADVIATSLTNFAEGTKLINKEEAASIKKDLEDYYKRELVVVRTNEELGSDATQNKFREDGYTIFVKHIGKEKADKLAALYDSGTEDCETKAKKDACCEQGEKESCKKK